MLWWDSYASCFLKKISKKVGKGNISCLKCIFHIFFFSFYCVMAHLISHWQEPGGHSLPFTKSISLGFLKQLHCLERQNFCGRGTMSHPRSLLGAVWTAGQCCGPFSGSPVQVPAFGDVVPRAMAEGWTWQCQVYSCTQWSWGSFPS